MMGELAASIAHEVNQPLAAVIANGHACMRWLGQETPDMREALEAVERIVRDAERASQVILRIRAFLRREVRQVIPTDLNEAVREVLIMMRAKISSQGISLRSATQPDLPAVAADRIQLQQVILNLVMNALDAMALVTGRTRLLQIDLFRHDEGALHVAIRDTGVGLTAEQRERVFDAFHTTKAHGMGMGLAISRSIIEAHGGRLWATPNADYGETFHFTLPIAAS
jgi:signal transduction histidine kinase